jgi:hypothetical protein
MTIRRQHSDAPFGSDVLRWGFAGVVAGAALVGLLTLIGAVVVVLQPPGWVQSLLGAGLAAGTGVLAWLVATALRPSQRSRPK